MSAAKKPQTNNEKLSLHVEKRSVLGKKVHGLRKEGKIPANIYGADFASTAITVDEKVLLEMHRRAGETQLVYIQLEKTELPVMIHNVQTHPVTGSALHADFRKVNLSQKIETPVPIKVIGESEAVEQKKGDLLTLADTLLVEALPTAVPQDIEIDISTLKEIDDEIKVGDLKAGAGFEFKDDADRVIVKIAEHKEEEEPEPVEAVEGEEGAEGAEGAEGGDAETPASEGEASKKEEESSEKK